MAGGPVFAHSLDVWLIAFGVESPNIRTLSASNDVGPHGSAMMSTATEATKAAAIEVPLKLPVCPSSPSEVMSTPGAKMSTHAPPLENEALRSVLSIAATVMALAAEAGE